MSFRLNEFSNSSFAAAGLSSLERAGGRDTELINRERRIMAEVAIAPPGYEVRVEWAAVAGATRAEVSAASILLDSAEVEEQLNDLPAAAKNNTITVTIPVGRLVRNLQLQNLMSGEVALNSRSDLEGASPIKRLVVGWRPALYAVPELYASGAAPASLNDPALSYQNNVLKLPDLNARKIDLRVVTGSSQNEFTPQPISVGKVGGTGVILPKNIEVVDPASKVVWNYPAELTPGAGIQTVELRVPLEQALNAALKAGTAPVATFKVRGNAPAKVQFRRGAITGALVRDFPGVVRTDLLGDPGLGAPGAAPTGTLQGGLNLAAEQPSLVRADLTIRYEGIRLHETLSDPLPGGVISGLVVGDSPVYRHFPPAAFNDLAIARLGLIGRAPVACELSVQVVEWSTGQPGPPLGAPGVIKLEPDSRIGTVWLEFKNLNRASGPVALLVRANQGRFLWVGEPTPLVRVAIFDPDPGHRALELGGAELLRLDRTALDQKNSLQLPGYHFPASRWRNSVPLFNSSLFLTVDISDLELRYGR